MITKLEHNGIRGIVLEWFKSYLTNRKHFVNFNEVSSDVNQVTYGVPQGSVLGPILLLMYVNELPNSLMMLKAILFVDYATVYASFSSLSSSSRTY